MKIQSCITHEVKEVSMNGSTVLVCQSCGALFLRLTK